ncbi:MAG: histidine kinase dimerization/phospho-acceptor domain-containing protein [Owenweeksia sp.]|nr:histidine kinase dimerization/phospho-acceptor domain-containing protein [Owenweeksia sp.]
MNQLFDFFNNLLNTNQQHPHWPYAGWSEFHHWLHISSTAVIWLSYLILLLFLATLILRKNKVVVPQSIWWLAAFICLSGFTHLMDIVVIWWPAYRLHTLVRLLTALLAVGAVFSLLPNFYSILDLKSSKAFDQELNRLEKTELQLRKAKQELENNNRELMVKNEEVQQLATIVSHDLKAPLQSFTSVLDLLKKQTNLLKENEPGEYIGYLEESSERMQTLITDLLDYARLGSRRELSEVNLNDILLQARSDLRAQIEASTAEIRVDSMPTINGYKTELRMLFQNLLNNALKI